MIVVVDDGFVEFLAVGEQSFSIGDAQKGFAVWRLLLIFQNFHENFQIFFAVYQHFVEADCAGSAFEVNFFKDKQR